MQRTIGTSYLFSPTAAAAPTTWLARVNQFTIRLLRGVAATTIPVLVLQQTDSDITLPINVSVHDFYGGVILGLFGDKVGEAIIKKIFG